MKIQRAALYEYTLNYAHGDYVMSGGRSASSQRGVLLKLETDDGAAGWGECTPLGSTYLPVSAGAVRAWLEEILPAIVGLDPRYPNAIRRRMDDTLRGATFAKSAVDIACWDLRGKLYGAPLSELLGGAVREDFPLYEAVPLAAPGQVADFVERRRMAGVNQFQLKVGNDPGEDVDRVHAALAAGDEQTLVIADANGGWNLYRATEAIRRLEHDRVIIEQPCRTTADSVAAHHGSRLPLVLDESITSMADLAEARTIASAVAVNIKLGRVGGITPAAQLRDLAVGLGMMVSIEDTWGGDVITAAVAHLAATTEPENLLTASFFNDWTDGHVAGHHPRSAQGRGRAPAGPGLGITVAEEAVGAPVVVD